MEYTPIDIARMMVAQETLVLARQTFRRNPSEGLARNLLAVIDDYERIVSEEVKDEVKEDSTGMRRECQHYIPNEKLEDFVKKD